MQESLHSVSSTSASADWAAALLRIEVTSSPTSLIASAGNGHSMNSLTTLSVMDPSSADSLSHLRMQYNLNHSGHQGNLTNGSGGMLFSKKDGAADLMPVMDSDGGSVDFSLAAPLGIVLNSDAMDQYNLVWRFLLQIKRAKYILEVGPHNGRQSSGGRNSIGSGRRMQYRDDVMNDAMEHDEEDDEEVVLSAASRQLHHFKIVQAEMLHFVTNLHNYVMTRVLHSMWLDLESDLEAADAAGLGLDDIIKLHHRYLNSICGHCLLNSGAVPARRAVMSCLSLILRFQKRYNAYVRRGAAPHALGTSGADSTQRLLADMASAETEFRKQVRLLLRMVASITNKGMYPHLEDLMLRLNFNHFY